MLKSFFAELKRRKVLRVAGAYAVVSWGALQIADKLFPALTLPLWTITFVAMLLLIGLPFVVIITWAFEITPDGIRRTPAELDVGPPPARTAWVEAALLLSILAVVGISIAQFTRHESTPIPAQAPEHTVEADPGAVANSIAVLPFTSFSDDADSNYFADGLTEELINDLANINGLKVSGRTSSFYYKNRNEDLREIGRTLGVAQVLEGSVRRSGDKLRITVQLISTADGFHLWSQTYDRAMSDIFAIQDDVADNVAKMLEMKLRTPQTASGTMHDSEDYRLYLIASALLHERAQEPLTQARELFTQLKDREPDNVDALAGYTQATMLLAGAFMTLDFEPAATDAIATIQRALAIDPNSVTANIAAGMAYTVLLHRTDSARYRKLAETTLSHAVELAPEDPEALAAYGTLLNEMSRFNDAHVALSRAVKRDPLSRLAQAQLIFALEGLGRLAEARERLVTLMQMYPDYVFAQSELGELLIQQGQIDAAVPYLKHAHDAKTSPRATFVLAAAYQNLGLDQQMQTTLDELDYSPLSKPFAEVIRLNVRGDDAAAFRLAQTQLAKTDDPIWRAMLINAALLLGDLPTARRELMRVDPTLLTSFDAAHLQPESALFAGELLLREGHTEDATRLLEALLTAEAPPAHGYDRVDHKLNRAKALALLGRNDAAIEELRAAQLQGNRLLWDFDYFQRLDRLSPFVSLRNDHRFAAMIAEIETDNRAMRDRFLQSQTVKEG